MTLTIKQEAQRVDSAQWQWAVWLDGTGEELDHVFEVVYTLHSSFSQPIQVVSDRSSSFRFEARAWGEFQLHARADMKLGPSVELTHWLRLEANYAAATRHATIDAPLQSNVFVSARVADEPFAEDLRQALQTQGVRTLEAAKITAGSSWTDSMEQAVRKADGLVMLVTGRISPWMEQEARSFIKQGKTVVPVLVNGATLESEDLREIHALQLKTGPDRNPAEAVQIAQRVQEILSEN